MLKEELGYLLASLAETKELKQVAVYSEPAPFRQASLQFTKVMAGEINNDTAVGTNQMVVVLWGTGCVAARDTTGA